MNVLNKSSNLGGYKAAARENRLSQALINKHNNNKTNGSVSSSNVLGLGEGNQLNTVRDHYQNAINQIQDNRNRNSESARSFGEIRVKKGTRRT